MTADNLDYMERHIVTGLIVSDEYIERVSAFWDPLLLESPELRQVAGWCMDYYDKYHKAPDTTIEAIYMDKLPSLQKADAQYIEGVLESLSDEFGRGAQFNAGYLYDQTVRYFKSQRLAQHNDEIKAMVDAGRVEEAEILAQSYTAGAEEAAVGLELSSDEALDRVEKAFSDTSQKVFSYPGALGDMLNEHLIRGGFVTLLAPEKRGKTFMLLEMSLRAIRQKANVAFFEAGDMTESQLLKRVCVYVAKRSDKMKYCQEHFQPVGDCILNQLDLCDRDDRNCDHGIFDVPISVFCSKEQNRYVNISVLKEQYEAFPDYVPCDSHGCTQRKGTVWIKKIKRTTPLTGKQAKAKLKSFFKRYKRRFRLATYPAGTLTVEEMRKCLDIWERRDGFVPDVIVIDYADLLAAGEGISEFRHKQDHIWKGLRGLSQERHALVLTATQADADSYKRGRLSLSNFSEDKRKLSHVTAQYGLNQDPEGREKRLGILRINEIVVREGEFSPDNEVVVLQDLSIGRPYLESYRSTLNEKAPTEYTIDEEEE